MLPAARQPSAAAAPPVLPPVPRPVSAAVAVPAAPDATLTLQIAEAVAEAVRRTEATAAARYERALISVLQTLKPTLAAGEQAQERVRRAWVGAGRTWEDPDPQERSLTMNSYTQAEVELSEGGG